MYCRFCGTPIETNQTLCMSCGKRHNASAADTGVKYFWIPLIFIGIMFLCGIGSVLAVPTVLSVLSYIDGMADIFRYALGLLALVTGIIYGWTAIVLFKRKPGCLVRLKWTLFLGFSLVGVFIVCGVIGNDIDLVRATAQLLIFSIVCFFYFRKSATVRQIYGANL